MCTSAISWRRSLTPCLTSIHLRGLGARDLPCDPTRLCLCRAAVLFLVFWPSSSIHGGLFAVLVKFQSAAYATSAYCICFCALWKCCCCFYYYYYYYYALEVWVRSKSLLGAVLCTSYTEKCCLPARASTHFCPCRALCSLAKSWLQFRQKMWFYMLHFKDGIATFSLQKLKKLGR